MVGKLTVFVTAITWLAQSGDRSRSAINADWQVLSLAQTQKANAGRIDALEDLNHRHVDLYGFSLTDGAKLRRLKLDGALLSDVTITNADLSNANFRGADLSRAHLMNSTLAGADFDGAALIQTDFSSTDKPPPFDRGRIPVLHTSLTGATLRGAVVCLANFRSVDLRSAHFGEPGDRMTPQSRSSKMMQGASACAPPNPPDIVTRLANFAFKRKPPSYIISSTFDDAVADEADFSSTALNAVSFRGLRRLLSGWVALTYTPTFDFHKQPLSPLLDSKPAIYVDNYALAPTSSKPPSFARAYLKAITFDSANLSDVSFEDATLEQVSFSGACLNGASFKGARLRFVDFSGAVFNEHTDFRGADLPDARNLIPGRPGDMTIPTIFAGINFGDAIFEDRFRQVYPPLRIQRHDARDATDLTRFIPRPHGQYRPGVTALCISASGNGPMVPTPPLPAP